MNHRWRRVKIAKRFLRDLRTAPWTRSPRIMRRTSRPLKDVEFDKAPFGILGFENRSMPGARTTVHSGRISLMRMVELFHRRAGASA